MNEYKISILDALKIYNSDKDFIVFETDTQSKIKNFILTNDLHRHYKKDINKFRILDVIKNEIKTVTIK